MFKNIWYEKEFLLESFVKMGPKYGVKNKFQNGRYKSNLHTSYFKKQFSKNILQ